MSELPLQGMRVVVTGDVPGLDRAAANDAVTSLGGTPSSSVSAKTDLLVVGARAGASKLAKAAALQLLVLPAEQFAVLAENPDSWDGTPLGTFAAPAEPGHAADAPTSTRPEAPVHSAHPASTSSWTHPDGVYRTRVVCRCGRWSVIADRRSDALREHEAHRADEGEDPPA